MHSSSFAVVRSLWRWLTEPAASITDVEARHRARAVASTLLLTIALIVIPLIQRAGSGETPQPLVFILVLAAAAYGVSRTRYYRLGGLLAVAALWLLPTYALIIGYSNMPSFILSVVRLLLLALLITYIMFSLRVSIVLALLIGVGFLLTPPAPGLAAPGQLASDFLLTAAAVFFVFVITRQYDIAERQHAQAAQRASEERYRAIVETQTEMVSRWLPDMTLTFVNQAYCRYFGRTPETLIGTNFSEVVVPADIHLIAEADAKITPENPVVTYEHRVFTASGAIGWTQWTDRALFDERGRVAEYQSVGRDITERKRAEQALSASERRYRAIVEIQHEMICRWLPDKTITFVNQAYCRYFARSREELVGSPVLALIYPDDVAHVTAMIEMISSAQPTVTYEHRVHDPAGDLRWHQWTDQAIFNGDGQVIEYQSVGRDITELKRAEEAEREQRQFAEALASTASLISSTLDLDEVLDRILNQVAMVNPLNTAEIILLEGTTAYLVRTRGYVDSGQQQQVMATHFSLDETPNLREMVRSGRPLIIADARDYPGWIYVEASLWIRANVGAPIRLEGETIGFLSMNSSTPGIFTEQHAERLQAFADQAAIAIRNARLYDEVRRHAGELEGLVKERTAELELERQRLRAILDGTGEGIFYTEREKIQYANPAFCKLTGYTQEEIVGQDYVVLYTPQTAPDATDQLDYMREALRRMSVWRGELSVRRKDGTDFDAGLTIATLGSSLPLRAVTVVRDISQQKMLEAQRSNLVAYASHELRTPITNMKTRLYLLRRRPEYLEEHLLILDEVTERMHRLVEDLLHISRLEHGLIPMRREDVSLQDVVATVVALQQPEAEIKRLDLHCTLTDEPITVTGDRERLIQVLTNLVTNAINYTPSGGQVVITTRRENGAALIEVADTGIGIAPESLALIFQPFYRVVSEVEGTGLGLSIAKEIVTLHGGALDVQSAPNRGSTFTVKLPMHVG